MSTTTAATGVPTTTTTAPSTFSLSHPASSARGWSSKKRWGIVLVGVSGVATTILLALLLSGVLNNIHMEGPTCQNGGGVVCLTKGCLLAATSLLETMDESVDPCTNFYDFACGGFKKEVDVDYGLNRLEGRIYDKLQSQLRSILEAPPMPDELKPFRLTKNLYQSCLNTSRIEKRGLDPLREILKKLGGWPVLEGDQWDPSAFAWTETAHRFRKNGYGFADLINFSVGTDYKNSTTRVIYIDSPALGLSQDLILKDLDEPEVKAYHKFQIEMAMLLGADRVTAEREMKSALEFERQVANFSLPIEERRNATKLNNPMTIAELERQVPSIPWLQYFTAILPPEVKVSSDEVVVVMEPSYISKMAKLITQSDKRVQANYVMWRAVKYSTEGMNQEVRDLVLEYSKTLTGTGEHGSRWWDCIHVVSRRMGIAIGAQYVRRYFKEEARETVLVMVENIRKSFVESLDQIDWMDKITKERAYHKAVSMAAHIGYPKELLNDTKLTELFARLELGNDSYFENLRNLTLFWFDFNYNRLRQRVNKTDWVSIGDATDVNAYYSRSWNSIRFPAGILQGVYFDNDRPRYMNYGAIGRVIGHEVTHGFDDMGRQFDEEGALNDWWEPAAKEAFARRAQCIISQYSNYAVPEIGLNLNGINTQGENIADNGGIKAAYNAYQAEVHRTGPELLLPGLNYTQNQLFWISAARIYCEKYRPERLKLDVLTGAHSPGEFRVRGSFSNMQSFSEDFNCAPSSLMNSANKCQVW